MQVLLVVEDVRSFWVPCYHTLTFWDASPAASYFKRKQKRDAWVIDTASRYTPLEDAACVTDCSGTHIGESDTAGILLDTLERKFINFEKR
jgi:hypothetical protein